VITARVLTLSLLVAGLALAGPALADEEPISGPVKTVDQAAGTLTVQATSKGKTREVVIVVGPTARIVKFVRPTEPGKTGFVEQALGLADLKPGWIVSVTARHDGGREVAEVVKVVLER
jgi:hypothetical protein